MTPKFSIITCTKNSARYLKDNIGSVARQTFRDYEHLFVDGYSNDGTKEMISEYQKTNPPRIIFFQTEPKGIADAMNRGIECSRGEYLIHLHSDDYFHDEKALEEVNRFLENNVNPDWIYSKEMQVGSSGREIKVPNDKAIFKMGSKSFLSRYLLKYHDFVRHQSVFIKKSVFEKFGYFDESFPIAMDYDFWLRIRNKTHWLFFDRITDCFRMHDDGASSSPTAKTKMLLDEMRAGRLHMNWFEFYILRFMFKISAKLIAETELQISLYKSFIKRILKEKP